MQNNGLRIAASTTSFICLHTLASAVTANNDFKEKLYICFLSSSRDKLLFQNQAIYRATNLHKLSTFAHTFCVSVAAKLQHYCQRQFRF
jgi:hypothetical protein